MYVAVAGAFTGLIGTFGDAIPHVETSSRPSIDSESRSKVVQLFMTEVRPVGVDIIVFIIICLLIGFCVLVLHSLSISFLSPLLQLFSIKTKILEGIDARSVQTVLSKAHKLKNSARLIGAIRVQSIACDIEAFMRVVKRGEGIFDATPLLECVLALTLEAAEICEQESAAITACDRQVSFVFMYTRYVDMLICLSIRYTDESVSQFDSIISSQQQLQQLQQLVNLIIVLVRPPDLGAVDDGRR